MLPHTPVVNKAFSERGDYGVIKWDVLNVANLERIAIVFESMSSSWRQGVWLSTDEGIIINGQLCSSAVLWFDTAPKEVDVICRTKNGRLHIYNVWDRGLGKNSQSLTSGMRVEEFFGGRRYRCNDIGFDSTFDKLVFSLIRKPN